jgi:HprK-related kinase A
LKGPGLCLQTGPFVTRIQSAISSVAEGVGQLYADFPVAPSDGFVDFHVRVSRPRNLRRWFQPQVLFFHDNIPPFRPLPLDQAYPMLEWGLNWCISSHAHQYLIIHAAVIERGGRAAILPAPPGSGKSTLCAALINRGWRLLSDELTLIRSDGQIVPLARPVSLKNVSIGIIKEFEPSVVINQESRDTAKGTVAHMKPPSAAVARAAETARPAWIVFPRYVRGTDTRLDRRPKAQAFMELANNAFNYTLHGARGFAVLNNVVDACACFDFRYSQLDEAISAFAQLQPDT